MKNPIIKISCCFLILLCALSNKLHSQIFLAGTVYNYVDDGTPVNVVVYEDDKLYENIEANKKGKFRIRLNPNHYYMVSLTKPEHYTTKIAVDTHVPFKVDSDFFVEIPLETDLVQSYVGMDPEVMKKPLSIFSYNESSGTFKQDDKYLELARQELEAFLYEAEKIDSKTAEELEDPDLDPDLENSEELADDLNFDTVEVYTATVNEEKKTYKELDESIAENNPPKKEPLAKSNDAILADNSSGPMASATDGTVRTINEQYETTADTAKEDSNPNNENGSEQYLNLRVKINGEEYNREDTKELELDNKNVEIEIMGLPDTDYSFIKYRLSGKDISFQSLESNEISYENLDDGNYTFSLRNEKAGIAEDLEVPFVIKATESEDSTWIYILAGIAAIILIIIVSRKNKDRDRIRVEK